MSKSLKLYGQTEDDLTVLSGLMQDAAVRVGDMAYDPAVRRFAMVANRFRWEQADAGRKRRPGERVRTGLHFNSVESVALKGVDRGKPDAVLDLLAITWQADADGTGNVTLIFAGGASVRVAVECIDAVLNDLSSAWPARARPAHEHDDRSKEERPETVQDGDASWN